MKLKLKDQSGLSRAEYVCMFAQSSLSLKERRHRVHATGGAGFSLPSISPRARTILAFSSVSKVGSWGIFCFLQHFTEPRQLHALARGRVGLKGGHACTLRVDVAVWGGLRHQHSALPAQALFNATEEKEAPLWSQLWDQFQKDFG